MRIRRVSLAATLWLACALLGTSGASAHQSVAQATGASSKTVGEAAAFDASPTLRSLQTIRRAAALPSDFPSAEPPEPPAEGDTAVSGDFTGDAALQAAQGSAGNSLSTAVNFEGLSNLDNVSFLGHGWLPPDPVGVVGRNFYIEMVNTVFAVYNKQGTRVFGPFLLGSLWQGFAVKDCAGNSGDPVVLYDKRADRWILTQFTSAGPIYYNCVAVSRTSDPAGAYFRYAFSSGLFFPDYPKYSIWKNSYLLTSRDFGPTTEYGISAYALERSKMLRGSAHARMVHFFLDSAVVPIYLMGDGLLPADIDGSKQPQDDAAPVVGTMNKTGVYGAPFDALNIFELSVDWQDVNEASFGLVAQLPVAAFSSRFPCTDKITPVPQGGPPNSQTRSCIPQPGTTRKLDALSIRQRPTFRLAFRNFGDYETMVTNQSVQAAPGVAGVRWYEIRRVDGKYTLHQQGTYAPADGVNRWMGSIAMDQTGNVGLGYSVSNATDVFPGIRFTGRLSDDPLGQMTQGEGVIINGSGSQRHAASRWGDYTTMTVDPRDDCTFWYVNQYIQTTGSAPWQTRIASFKLPGCGNENNQQGGGGGGNRG